MKYTLTEIINKMESDIEWHSTEKSRYPDNSPEWNFHLGWLDSLVSYRYKLQYILDESK